MNISINNEIINQICVFEIHLRRGGGNYASNGYYYMISKNGNTPSWDIVMSLIEYLYPNTQDTANPVHPFYLDLGGKFFTSVVENENIFLDLFHRFSEEQISLVLSKLNDGYLIYDGLTFDDKEEVKNGLLSKNGKLVVFKWDGELEYI